MNFKEKIMLKTVICTLYIKIININIKYKYSEVDETDTQKLLSWQAAGISNEKLTPIKDTNSPSLLFEKTKQYLKISSFKFVAQGKIYNHDNIVNIYIVYFMLNITDAKRADLMKYGLFGATGYDANNKLVGYGVEFRTQKCTHDDGKEARNLVILGVNSNALVLGKGSIKITTKDNDDNSESFLFVDGVEQYKFKADKNEIVSRKLNLGSISDNSVLHYSHTVNGNIYNFALDYKAATINKIQKSHKYLMNKHNIK